MDGKTLNSDTTSSKTSGEASFARRALALAGALTILDQATKALIEKNAANLPVPVIPGFFDIVQVGNTGAAWGMFKDQRWPLLAVSIVFLVVIVVSVRRLTEGWPERYYAMGMIIAGILGNSIDRIWRGAVVDFLDFHAFGHHWPAFNVADSSICIGVGIYIISSFKRPPPNLEAKEKAK
jgi:signal peptidase II